MTHVHFFTDLSIERPSDRTSELKHPSDNYRVSNAKLIFYLLLAFNLLRRVLVLSRTLIGFTLPMELSVNVIDARTSPDISSDADHTRMDLIKIMENV